MTSIDVITGLRGAGKTTVINQILKEGYSKIRVSVIQNELGKITLESQLLTNGPASLEQMTGGCVCCTLQTNLLEGIRRQTATTRPETIILEAAGEGRPADILHLCDYQQDLIPHICLHVIDGSRYLALRSLMGNALTAPIKQSSLLYVNRLPIHPNRIRDVLRDLRDLQPDAYILHDAADLLPEEYQSDRRMDAFSVQSLLALAGKLPVHTSTTVKSETARRNFIPIQMPR